MLQNFLSTTNDATNKNVHTHEPFSIKLFKKFNYLQAIDFHIQ